MESIKSKQLNAILGIDSILQLLWGKFSKENFKNVREVIPNGKLMIFFSSTFTDTHAERNVIMEEILPELQRKGKEYGVTVIFVDMRFGVKDENTKDHMTWIACAEQIRYCYEESDGMFFMSLQGDKYGYMPIPKFINQSLVEDRIKQLDPTVMEFISNWYLLDENSVPPQYTLKHLVDKDDNEFWSSALPTLREALEGIAYDEENSSDIVIYRSVTEWEALLAMKLSSQRCSWFRRSFESGIDVTFDDNRKVVDYCDFLNNSKTKQKFDNLISVMSNQIPHLNITRLEGPSLKSYMDKDNSFDSYLKTFKSKMMKTLSMELEKVIIRNQLWNRDGNGLGFSGEVFGEMIHHCRILYDKCNSFQGREDLLTESLRYLTNGTNSNGQDQLLDISLSIIGISGSGKTALMSKLAETCQSIFPSIPIIVRFCGTSKGSVDGLVLITSICQQLQLVHGLELKEISSVYEDVVNYFHELVLTHPVILFIDSLDQLTDAHMARSKLSFLIGIKCHQDTRIIVSALPDDKDPVTNKWGKYVYLCDTRLEEFRVPRVVVKVLEVGSNETESILSGILSLGNKKLTRLQTESVLSSLSFEPTALYLNLAVNVVLQWQSYDIDVNKQEKHGHCLQESVFGLINQIFDKLEADFGPVLTRYSVGFIAFSRIGVSNTMMQDLLSLRDDVLAEVFQYSKPEKYNRVPLHVWLRLCSAMKGLIVVRSFNCWNWYHRQLSETVVKRYSEDEIRVIHETIGRYMCNIVPKGIIEKRLITSQPLTFTPMSIWFKKSVINEQRFTEGFYHLVHGDLLTEAVNEMTRFDVICGCILAGQGYHVIECLQLLTFKLKKIERLYDRNVIERVGHYFRWLYQDMSFLSTEPRYRMPSSATSQPNSSIVKKEMVELIEETRNPVGHGVTSLFNGDDWIRMKTLGGFEAFTPCLATLVGHSLDVRSACFSSDGKRIISGSDDTTIKIWDTLSGACVNTLEGHSMGITSVCISCDGSRIVSGSYDQMVKIWDAVSGICINTLEGHSGYVRAVCISIDGSRIISGSEDEFVKVWDAATGSCLKTFADHNGEISSVCISNDGTRIISGSSNQTVKIWDLVSGECVNTLDGRVGGIESVCISSDGSRIISGSDDHTVRVWDATTGECINTLEGHKHVVTSVCISSDGKRIISGSVDQTVKIWDAVSGTCVNTFEGHTAYNTMVLSVCISSDGNRIVSGSDDQTLKIWDAVSQPCVNTFVGHIERVYAVSISSDGKRVVSGSVDKTLKVWDTTTGTCLNTLKDHSKYVTSVCISSDGKRIISGSDDTTIKIWDMITGDCVNTLEGHRDRVVSVFINSNGTRIVSGSCDTTIKIWDVVSGKCVNSLQGHSDEVTSVCMSSDGNIIVSGSGDRTIKIWDTVSGKCVQTIEGHNGYVTSVCISNDGKKFISGSDDKSVKVWDALNGTCLNNLEGQNTMGISSICISSDGSRIISGSHDNTVKVWDATTGECINTLKGHIDRVRSVCISSDGSRIVSGSSDNTVKIWDAISNPLG